MGEFLLGWMKKGWIKLGHPLRSREWIREVRRYLERLRDIPGSVNTIQISETFVDAHASLYLLLTAWPSARLSQLALTKDDINAHPLQPMSYWFSNKTP